MAIMKTIDELADELYTEGYHNACDDMGCDPRSTIQWQNVVDFDRDKLLKEEFDNIRRSGRRLHLDAGTREVTLDSDFTRQELRLIAHVMDNHPEWF